MTAFQRLQSAYFLWRVENEVPDDECIIIRVTFEFRCEVLKSDTRGVWFVESDDANGRKERILGCPFEAVKPGVIEGDFEFVRANHDSNGFVPSFLVDPDIWSK